MLGIGEWGGRKEQRNKEQENREAAFFVLGSLFLVLRSPQCLTAPLASANDALNED